MRPSPRTPRPYRSDQRVEQARETRRRVLRAATAAFLERGYGATTMAAVARAAEVSVPTVEQLFGTKPRLLKAAIDVAIAGDDEPVPVLDRDWTEEVLAADGVDDLLAATTTVLAAAQARSAGLIMAAFEGAAASADLADLTRQLIAQRATTAGWLVDTLTRVTPLRPDCSRDEAVETLWILMDPTVFVRLTRDRGRSVDDYRHWFARSVRHLLLPDPPA